MREKSCGTVTFTTAYGGIKYLLTQTDYGVYGFAKGHVEDGESERQTAIRETWEETSVKPKIVNGFRKTIEYALKNGNEKTVVFFLGDFGTQQPCHNDGFENITYKIVPYEEALELLTFDNTKRILKSAHAFLTKKYADACDTKKHALPVIATKRTIMRRICREDYPALCEILQDDQTMWAYEGAFSDEEVQCWIDRQLSRYEQYDFGLWAVIEKQSGRLIGQCGLTMQTWKDTQVLEIGYLFNKEFWHNGYAIECAKACKKYAFDTLGATEVCSIIRNTNIPSQNVALRNGMIKTDEWTKHYRGVDMPHYKYTIKKEEEE